METALILAAETLTSPMILFFVLGVAITLVQTELVLPSQVSKVLSLYLLFVIGFKGGASVAEFGADGRMLTTLAAGALLSFLMPLLAFGLLRAGTGLDRVNAAAVSAHYGSISIVTFATMAALLKASQVPYEGWMVAVAAVMEAPAILMALVIARSALGQPALAGGVSGGTMGTGGVATVDRPDLGDAMRHALTNNAVLLLFGAFAFGWVAGELGAEWQGSFIERHFPAVLCIFLLDQGMGVGRGLKSAIGQINLRLGAFAIVMPLIGAVLGLLSGWALGLSEGGIALLATLCASASYIAAPAAMRAALPEAKPEIYLTLSLCFSFPFNLIVGLPLYLTAAGWLAGAAP